MILPNIQIVSLAEAHLNLDGIPEKPFVFGAKFRYTLVRNLRLLQQHVRDIDKKRVAIIKAIAPGDLKIEKDTPQAIEFEQRYDALMAEDADIPVHTLKLSEFNLDQNNIPVRVLSALGPVICEDTDFA